MPRIKQKNIDVHGTLFPGNLRCRREALQLTKAELAARAELSPRTIQDLESGRRDRIQEKTLILLAQALEISIDTLTGRENGNGNGADGNGPSAQPPAWTSPKHWAVYGPVILFVLIFGFLAVRDYSLSHAKVVIEDNRLRLEDGLLGHEVWKQDFPAKTLMVDEAPWDEQILLVGLKGENSDSPKFVAVDRRTGAQLWSVQPDMTILKAAFGEAIFEGGNMNYIKHLDCNLYGPDEPVVAVLFCHSMMYPMALCVVDHSGHIRDQYSFKGHVNDLQAVDLDRDGRDELVAGGCNNSKLYQGAMVTILDADHFSGASVDPVANPESLCPDNSLRRIVFPQYPEPIMVQLGLNRLSAFRMHITPGTDPGTPQLAVEIGSNALNCLIVYLDAELTPIRSTLGDAFDQAIRNEWPEDLRAAENPADEAWRTQWISRHVRFEEGKISADLLAESGR